MNVAQLKHKLANFPDNMDVFIEVNNTDFTYSLLNVAEKRKITFSECDDSTIKATDNVLILSDD